ncbi:hypothetical protein RF11_01652 [Thelohanellus kitauei]|uniref:Uncharacterized protein n=1 Tax=Thelohanellus kitauei TaxID=669202 RepID=A0A0C2N8G4_THEKT|nr:hypothetical protein RF11_01652 [Thelohanellus kitauei]
MAGIVALVQHGNTFTPQQAYCFLFDFSTKLLRHPIFVKYARLPINFKFNSKIHDKILISQNKSFKELMVTTMLAFGPWEVEITEFQVLPLNYLKWDTIG